MLHSTQSGVGEAAAQAFSSVAGLVAMLLVKEDVERSMEGLYLRFARSAKETMPLSKVDGVMQHVKLGEWLRMCFRLPVLMNVAHSSAPGVDVTSCPVVGVKQAMMQLLQPACEDGV